MDTRAWLIVLFVLAGSLSGRPVDAQRSGFIMGVGVGPEWLSSKSSLGQYGIPDEGESRFGLATNFHMGGVVGSVELYWMLHMVYHGTEVTGATRAATFLTGLGVTYPLNATVSIKAGAGFGEQAAVLSNGARWQSWDGVGLLAGGRYGLSDRWALDLDITRGGWDFGGGPLSFWGIGLTMNVLSH